MQTMFSAADFRCFEFIAVGKLYIKRLRNFAANVGEGAALQHGGFERQLRRKPRNYFFGRRNLSRLEIDDRPAAIEEAFYTIGLSCEREDAAVGERNRQPTAVFYLAKIRLRAASL